MGWMMAENEVQQVCFEILSVLFCVLLGLGACVAAALIYVFMFVEGK